MPRVWSVPSISIKRRLGTIEVSNDDKLTTIKEDGGATNIYIREAISDQPRVIYELLEYFKSLFEIDAKHHNLVNCLMSTSLLELPEIMERFDLALPEDSDDESTDDQSSDDEDEHDATTAAPRLVDLSIEPTAGSRDEGRFSDLERQFGDLGISPEAEDNDADFVEPPNSSHRQPLQELIPSHQARTERIL